MDNRAFITQLIYRFQSADEKLVAFSLYDGVQVTEITYRRFAADILKTAGYFAANQITGKHVALAGPNSYRWIVVFFAVAATGNVVVPLNQALPADMLQWQCKKADIALLCYDDSEITDKIDEIPAVSFDIIHAEKALSCHELYSHDKDKTVVMIFTSGTTGRSKTVMLSAKNLFSSAANVFTAHKMLAEKQEPVVDLLSLPLYHIGMLRALLNRLVCGDTLAIGRGAKYVFMDMPKLNPTHVSMVPAMAESLAKIIRKTPSEKMVGYVGSSLKGVLVVGASMKPTVARYLLEQGICINIIYGMTESAGDGAWCVLDADHIGTIGKPDGNIDFRILNPADIFVRKLVHANFYTILRFQTEL